MTGKGLAAALGILLASASTAVAGASQFGESCVGTEIVQVDGQPAKNLPYSLVFSVDTKRKLYCYGECLEGQTYSVSDPLSSPMKLADIDVGVQVRHITFDRVSSKIADYQVIDAKVWKLTRRASGTCKPAPFRSPRGQPD